MKISIRNSMVCLQGDWSIHRYTQAHIDSLISVLSQLDQGHGKKLTINCSDVKAIDRNGMELLYVWIECIRMRGYDSILTNMPANLRSLSSGVFFTKTHAQRNDNAELLDAA